MYFYNDNSNDTGGRDYQNWSHKRNNTTQALNNIPFITTVVDGTKRYYSTVDAEIYLGDIYIDEVTNVVWSIQQQTLPIYGYNSYTFDDCAVGSRLIQGQFAINFTQRGFLTTLQNNSSAFATISRRMYGDDSQATTVHTDSLRQRLSLPKWDKGFDIVIGFGYQSGVSNLKSDIYSTYLVLDCVQVTGSTLQLDYSGNVVQEIYTFIARDLIETNLTQSNNSTTQTTESAVNENSEQLTANNNNIQFNGSVSLYGENAFFVQVHTDSKIELTSCKFNLTDNYKDKNLNSIVTMNVIPDDQTARYIYKDSSISELSNKEKVMGHLDYTYKENGVEKKGSSDFNMSVYKTNNTSNKSL